MRTHEWRQLSADATAAGEQRDPTLYSAYQEIQRRLDTVETALSGHALKFADHVNVADHFQLSLDEHASHVADVQETLTNLLKKSLSDHNCLQSQAHNNLKAAFGELAKRLESQKNAHVGLAEAVADHHDALVNLPLDLLHSAIATAENHITELSIAVKAIPAPTLPAPSRLPWESYLAFLLAILAIALQLFHGAL